MNTRQLQALALRDTDVDGAIYRCCGDEKLYALCLKNFLTDKTMNELAQTIDMRAWDDAFTAAHALKGLAGNMGFVPLMHATGRLVVLIRSGRTDEINDAMENVRSQYRDVIDGVKQFLDYETICTEERKS